MVWGREKTYLGREALIIIITSICTPERGWDRMDCVRVVWMMCSINSSHHQLGTCWCSNTLLVLLSLVVHIENMYLIRYNVFTYNLIFYIYQSRQEWVDGIRWVWMMTSQLGRCSQWGSVLLLGSLGSVFYSKKGVLL
jgi:hypothetical protein